jgi:trans-aconitate 2-methyltransferase
LQTQTQTQTWNTKLYDQKHAFVYQLGKGVLELLAPQKGERILDLGSGTGHLTNQIAESGSEVIGLDNSLEMVAAAREEYPHIDFVHADASNFRLHAPFDAVFSNATLHWVTQAEQAASCIANALKPGGRFVAEFGGKGNMRHVTEAVRDAIKTTTGQEVHHTWYFPSVSEYATLLERHGLEVRSAWLFSRPTPLEGEDGMRNWLAMFGGGMFKGVADEAMAEVVSRAEASLRKTNRQPDGTWFADYRRIRVMAVAVKP